MNSEEWKQLCPMAWEIEYDYLQIHRFAKIREDRYTIRNWNGSIYIECIPETKPFQFLILKYDIFLKK